MGTVASVTTTGGCHRPLVFFKESARPGIELESKGEGDLVESLGLYQ